MARAGNPKMGVSSTFGSPLLTACLGIGISLAVYTSGNGPVVTTGDNSPFTGQVKMGFIFICTSITASLVAISLFRFRIPRYYAYVLWSLYGLYMVLVGCVATDKIKWGKGL